MADMLNKLSYVPIVSAEFHEFCTRMTSLIAFFPASAQMPLGLAVTGIFVMVLLLRPPYVR